MIVRSARLHAPSSPKHGRRCGRSPITHALVAGAMAASGCAHTNANVPTATSMAVAERGCETSIPRVPAREALSGLTLGHGLAIRFEARAFFDTRAGRLTAPLLIWHDGYAPLRGVCTLRPWEVVTRIDLMSGGDESVVTLVGPIADPSNRCAAVGFGALPVTPIGVETPSQRMLVVASDAESALALRVVDGVRTGSIDASLDIDEYPSGLRDAFVRVVIDGRLPESIPRLLAASEESEADAVGSYDASNTSLAAVTPRYLWLEIGLDSDDGLVIEATYVFVDDAAADRYLAYTERTFETLVTRDLRAFLLESAEGYDREALARDFSQQLLALRPELLAHDRNGRFVRTTLSGPVATSAVAPGIAAAVGIPAFIRFVKSSQAAEASANVGAISEGLLTLLGQRNARRLSFLPIPPTPASAPGAVRVLPTPELWSHPGWRAIGFAPTMGVHYQYRVDVDGSCYVVAAEGDLDGDGMRSRFSRRICPDARGGYDLSELSVENELE